MAMMLFAELGVGLLANLFMPHPSGPSLAQQQQLVNNMQTSLNTSAHTALEQAEPAPPTFSYEGEEIQAPPFPDQAARKLATMQQSHAGDRQALVAQTQDEVATTKQSFFTDHHLETEAAPDGQQQVVTDPNGHPQPEPGPETPPQQAARETFESTRKDQLDQKHDDDKQTFARDTRQQITTFLQAQKPDLTNPAVQGELQKLILQSHKKALGLTRRHEEESLKLDCYTAEQIEQVDGRLSQLQDMDERHAQEEDNSPEAQELMNHQQDLAELLRQKQEQARQAKMQEAFLQGRPHFSSQPDDQEVDVAKVLPPYLANSLYAMGIYTV